MRNLLLLAFLCLVGPVLYAGVLPQVREEGINSRSGYTENKGQIVDQYGQPNSHVLYLFNTAGMNVQLRKNGFSYDTYTTERKSVGTNEKPHLPPLNQPHEEVVYHFQRVDVEFSRANPHPQIVAKQPSAEYSNYYGRGTSERGACFVRNYQQVTYINLYDGIDLQFVVDGQSKPKFNFIIHPGADASQIRWKYRGAPEACIRKGRLILPLVSGELSEEIPESFVATTKEQVSVNYMLLPDHSFGFTIPLYDHHETLTIDPTPDLFWATYCGGTGRDYLSGPATDSVGNIFIGGSTGSASGIATSGTFQSTSFSGFGAFIVKFSPAGVRLWGTYFSSSSGGMGGSAIAVDRAGNCYLTGITMDQTGLATTGAHQMSNGGGTQIWDWYDGYLAKFNPDGLRVWSTFYGGASNDECEGIALDRNANVFITGTTHSGNGISTFGAHQYAKKDGMDVFLAKFDSSGTRRWGTYFGGDSMDRINRAIGTDDSGNVIISGLSESTSNIASAGAFQTTTGAGGSVFVAKFSSLGARVWATYYGGPLEWGSAVAADPGGNIFVTGYAGATTGIATPGAHQSSQQGASDMFVVKFSPAGSRLWATYYGGNDDDYGYGIVSDPFGNILLTGVTSSTNNISTSGAFRTIKPGLTNGFIVKFDAAGTRLWGTYYGGDSMDFPQGISRMRDGSIAVAGWTYSDSGLATPGAFQTGYLGGEYDGFIAKFNDGCSHIFNAVSNSPICTGNDIIFTVPSVGGSSASSYHWTGPNGFSRTDQMPYMQNASISQAGSYTVIRIDSGNGCYDTATVNVVVKTKPAVGFSQNKLITCYANNSFTLTDTSTISSGTIVKRLWRYSTGDTSSAPTSLKNFAAAGSYQVKLVATGSSGCTDSVTKTLQVYPQTHIGFIINNYSNCGVDHFLFTDTSTVSSGAYTRLWQLGNSISDTAAKVDTSFAIAGSYVFTLKTTTNKGCVDSIIKMASLGNPNPIPDAGFTQSAFAQCLAAGPFIFNDTSFISAGTITSTWRFSDGSSASGVNTAKSFVLPGTFTVKLVSVSSHNCSDSVTKSLTVYPQTNVGFTINHAVQCLQNSFVFTDTSSVSSGSYSFFWDAGDGTFFSAPVLHRSYSAGAYEVKLVATTNNGCMDSARQSILVRPYPKPEPGFTINDTSQCLAGNQFIFSDTSMISSGSVAALWLFSNGDSSSSSIFSRSFAIPGSYSLKLISASNQGCKDSISHVFTVHPQPASGFTVNNAAQCLKGNYFVCMDTSSVSAGSLFRAWKFGNGDTSSTANTATSFGSAGIYSARLVSITGEGCTDSVTRTLTVYPQPSAAVAASGATHFCAGDSVGLTANTGTGFSYQWTYNGADLGADTFSSTTASSSGAFAVMVTNSFGCSDTSAAVDVVVHPLPVATTSTTGPTIFCEGEKVLILVTADTGTTFGWLLQGVPVPGVDPFFAASVSGDYRVIAVNHFGCHDTSAVVKVVVYPYPAAVKIEGLREVNSNDTAVYSTVFNNHYSYEWNVQNGQIVTGQGTSSISVRWDNVKQGIVNVSVLNQSLCGEINRAWVAIHHIPDNNFILYPNPASDYIILRTVQSLKDADLTFTDMSGRKVYDEQITVDAFQRKFPLDEFARGVYILSIIRGDEVTRVKFVRE